jgi:hypothetical protein
LERLGLHDLNRKRFLIGNVAWPGPADPPWHSPVLVVGIMASIIGMLLRYKAHKDEQREQRKAKGEGGSAA